MSKYVLLSLLGLLCVGCATTQQVQNPWLGATKEQVINSFGLPNSEQEINGKDVMQYESCSAVGMTLPGLGNTSVNGQRSLCDVLLVTLVNDTVVSWATWRK